MSTDLDTPPASPIVHSALWAAWADALGFQTELAADGRQVQRRLGTEAVSQTVAWKRRVGGRFGVSAELPAGTYSDDTQLRLAVARCIRSSGRFDAEAFSKIELSVFPSYELGAGVGTKAAAAALAKKSVRWNSNFFSSGRSRYTEGGGNGAAMRIQPHVWAADDLRPDRYLPGVLRDALVTHGHARGILGAALHALALGSALREGALPEPPRWAGMVQYLAHVPRLLAEDEATAERWLPLWERETGRSFAEHVDDTCTELLAHVDQAQRATTSSSAAAKEYDYAELAERLGGLAPESRGSGTVSAVLSLWLAWQYRRAPADGLIGCSNLIGSDTDTVATMAGALLGAVSPLPPPGPVIDEALHAREAHRLERLAAGEPVEDFPHPDPLHWKAPATQADALGTLDGHPAVAGLGPCDPVSELLPSGGQDGGGWQWVLTGFGQHLLMKRRHELGALPDWMRPRQRSSQPAEATRVGVHKDDGRSEKDRRERRNVRPSGGAPRTQPAPTDLPPNVEEGIDLVVRSRFDAALMARLLVHYARQEHGTVRAGLFAAGVAERLRTQEQRG